MLKIRMKFNILADFKYTIRGIFNARNSET